MIAKIDNNCLLQFVDSEQTGLVDESQCRRCSPGFYCSEPGLSAVSGPCLPGQNKRPHNWFLTLMLFIFASAWFEVPPSGFFCLEGSQSSSPGSSMFGGICPVGHYCAESSSVPSPCPAGSYQNETGGKGKHDCNPCPPGMQTINNVAHMFSSWECHRCLNVFTRLVPRVFRAGKVRALSSRLPLPGTKFQPSALPSWLHLSWKSSSSALPRRHL